MSVDLSVSNTTKPDQGLIGGFADLDDTRTITLVATAATELGVAVKRTTGGGEVASDSADKIAGISVRDAARKTVSGNLAYAAGDGMAVNREGTIFVSPYENVTKDSPVYFRELDGRLGISTTSGSTGPVPDAYCDEAGSADGIVRVRMNMTN
jgi:hypothetical protein